VSRLPLVLVWTEAWINVRRARRAARGVCRITTDRSLHSRADAVVCPLPTLRAADPPGRAFPEQLLVLWSQESAVQYPDIADPAVRAGFDLIATYELDSDVPLPYLTPRVFAQRPPLVPLAARDETPVSAWVSSQWDRCGRDEYLLELMEHVRVHSFGAVGRNIELANDEGRRTKRVTIGNYRFTVAFENSMTRDYVTEKFVEPLVAGTVPLYRGAPNIADFAPAPDCYIDVTRFDSPSSLADYLRAMTDEEYLSFHRWRDDGPTAEWSRRFAPYATPTFVRLATAITTVNAGRAAARRALAPPRSRQPSPRRRDRQGPPAG
jgi:hypothetical protein